MFKSTRASLTHSPFLSTTLDLKNLKCKTRSLTGALLGLVTPNCTDFRPPNYPLSIASCYQSTNFLLDLL